MATPDKAFLMDLCYRAGLLVDEDPRVRERTQCILDEGKETREALRKAAKMIQDSANLGATKAEIATALFRAGAQWDTGEDAITGYEIRNLVSDWLFEFQSRDPSASNPIADTQCARCAILKLADEIHAGRLGGWETTDGPTVEHTITIDNLDSSYIDAPEMRLYKSLVARSGASEASARAEQKSGDPEPTARFTFSIAAHVVVEGGSSQDERDRLQNEFVIEHGLQLADEHDAARRRALEDQLVRFEAAAECTFREWLRRRRLGDDQPR
jgi:hypothetical protein